MELSPHGRSARWPTVQRRPGGDKAELGGLPSLQAQVDLRLMLLQSASELELAALNTSGARAEAAGFQCCVAAGEQLSGCSGCRRTRGEARSAQWRSRHAGHAHPWHRQSGS
jgi:hypothetical protein